MIILGLGSNLSSDFGDRFKNIDLAISFLKDKNIKSEQRNIAKTYTWKKCKDETVSFLKNYLI